MQEVQIYGLWAGKQTAKGTPNTAPGHRFKQVGGDFNAPREDGSENYSIGTQFTATQDWVNTLVGNGAPAIEATPDETAWQFWTMEGGETVTPQGGGMTGEPVKSRHSFHPLPGLGFWHTYATRLGSSTLTQRQWNDCQIGQIELGGSQGSKAIRVTPTVICLDPAQVRNSDPVAAIPDDRTFLYTDGTSRFTIDGTVARGHSEFTFVVNKDLQPVYSDDVTVYDLAIGNAVITISVTLFFDADGLAVFNKQLYGTAAPAANAKPIHNIPALGSYSFELWMTDATGARTFDDFKLDLPGVKWNVPDAPGPNPDGGAPSITLTGSYRPVTGQNPYNVDIDTDAAAFTA